MDKAPHIAISVDMLDTGIDVPEVVNLVFFKLVRSKTKFWQMLGRGTRLCPDLFAPGEDKAFFYVFDYCQNLEYFSQDIPGTEGVAAASLAKRLFDARLALIAALDRGSKDDLAHTLKEAMAGYSGPKTAMEVRQALAEHLQREVEAMNLDNFVVRPHRRLVEKYAKQEAWQSLAGDAMAELSHQVAGLPTGLDPENEEAKRFDLLALNLQIARLRAEPGFERMRDRVKEIAALLEEKEAIPLVREQMPLIQALGTDEWWQDVTVPMLEVMRRRLRMLVLLLQQEQARAELARLVMRERFGLVTSGIGVAFLLLLVVLPPLPWKWLFYCCALLCIFAGAWQKDYANKRIARVLPKLGVSGVIAMRPQARLERIRLLWSRLTRRSHNKP
jgi:type I restriction enzyme R subunit